MTRAPGHGSVRARIETGFEELGRFLVRRRWTMLATAVLLTGALGTQLPRLTFDTSVDSMLHPDDPKRIANEEFRRQFGRDDVIVIAIEAPDVFDPGFLEKLRALHTDLEDSVPHLDEITSLKNARLTRGEGDRLIVEDLMEEWPETEGDLELLRTRALSNPLYVNTLISEDASFTAVVLRMAAFSSAGALDEVLGGFDDPAAEPRPDEAPAFLTGAEHDAMVGAVLEVVARHDAPGFRLYPAGPPVMVMSLQRRMVSDLLRSVRLAVLTIGVLLLVIFRRALALVLPLAIVGLSLLCTLGLMGLVGIPISFGTQLLPSFLLAVGVGYAVHILTIFFQEYEKGVSKAEAIVFALGHSGLAVFLTALTTAGGLASFAAAQLQPIARLGAFAPVGVGLCFLYSILVLPALLALLPIRPRRREPASARTGSAERILVVIGDFATTHARSILWTFAVLVALALGAATRLRYGHDPIGWFPETDPLRVATELVDRELRGSMPLEVLVDTHAENGLHEPELLRRIEAMGRYAEEADHGVVGVGKAISVADVVKEIHQALNEGRREYRRVPSDRALVAQELLLFENSGSDDLEELVDASFRTARLTLRIEWTDAVAYPPFMERLQERFEAILGDGADLQFTGLIAMMSRTFHAVIQSMLSSYVLALLIITPLMILLIGDLRIGLASMAPNLTPIALTLGLMGCTDLPIDAFTLLVGGIAIGLAVDDTIHFMHNFRRYYVETGDTAESVRRTMRTTGRAIFFTSLVLTCGFLIFSFSPMLNLVRFGALTAFTIAVAFVADILISPALVAVLTRGRAPALAQIREEVRL